MAALFIVTLPSKGVRKAIMTWAHRLLVIAFCMLRDGTVYQEFEGDYFDKLNPVRTRNRLIRRLHKLGLRSRSHHGPTFPPYPIHYLRKLKENAGDPASVLND